MQECCAISLAVSGNIGMETGTEMEWFPIHIKLFVSHFSSCVINGNSINALKVPKKCL